MMTPALSRRVAVVHDYGNFYYYDDDEWRSFLGRLEAAGTFESLSARDRDEILYAEKLMPASLRTRWRDISQGAKHRENCGLACSDDDWLFEYGTAGSGNWGHAGIKGHRGGSLPTTGAAGSLISKVDPEQGAAMSTVSGPTAAARRLEALAKAAAAPDAGKKLSLEGRPAWLDTGPRLEASMEGGPQKIKEFNDTHAFVTKLETYADGTRAVVKPDTVHYGMHSDPRAEVAAYELDRVLGLDMVPATVFCERAEGTCSAQRWVENSTVAAETRKRPSEIEELKMRSFDAIIDNADRHSGNYLLTAQGTTALIDHGLAFGTSPYSRTAARDYGADNAKLIRGRWAGTKQGRELKAFGDKVASVPRSELVAAMKRSGYAEDSPETNALVARHMAIRSAIVAVNGRRKTADTRQMLDAFKKGIALDIVGVDTNMREWGRVIPRDGRFEVSPGMRDFWDELVAKEGGDEAKAYDRLPRYIGSGSRMMLRPL